MRPTGRSAGWCAVMVVLLGAATGLAETRGGETVVIGPGEIVRGDLYTAAGTVRIEGTVEGDVVSASGTLEIPGHVTGDVLSVAGTTRISGQVDGSVRVMGGRVEFLGQVEEDVLALAGSFQGETSGSIGRDFMASAGEVRLSAPVSGDVSLAAGSVVLGGAIEGKAKLETQALEVQDGARIAGPLEYRSATAAKISPAAEVGSISRLEPQRVGPGAQVFAFFFGWVRALFAFTLLGVLLAIISPRFATAVPRLLKTSPWHSLGWGALALAAAPFVTFALFMAGVLLGGWWLGLIAGAVVLTAVALAFPVVGFQLGQLVVARTGTLTRGRQFGALLVGVAVLTLVLRIPVLGALLALGVVLLGLGAMAQAGVQLRRAAPV